MRTLFNIFFLSLISIFYCNQALAGLPKLTNPETTITIDNYTTHTVAYNGFMPTLWNGVPMEQLISYSSKITPGTWGTIVIAATPTDLSGYLLASTFYKTTDYPNCTFRIDTLFDNNGKLFKTTCSAFSCGNVSCTTAGTDVILNQSMSS